MIIIDVKTGLPTSDRPAVTRNRMSWLRLAETLTNSGHVKRHEVLTHFIVHDDRIELCFETKTTVLGSG